jgi:hypothetical protein
MSVDAELAERVRNELMGEAGLAENAWVRQGVEFARGLPAKR